MAFQFIAALATFFLLGACAPSQDFSQAYQRYEKAYRQEHNFTVHQVPRDEFLLRAREFRPKGSEQEPPLVLMHGFPDSLHLYDRLAPLLAAERRVITFDFLGWGQSAKPSDHTYNVASLRRDLEAIIDYFELKEVVLVVHDASGQPGIDWVLDHPDRTAGLILLNTYYAPSERLVPPPAIKRFSTPGIERDLLVFGASRNDGQWQSGFIEQVGQFILDPQVRDDFVKLFAHQAMEIRPAFFGLNRVLLEEVRARAPRVAELRTLPVPVKIVFGADDPYLNADVAREFDELLPNSRLHLVQAAAHYVQLDQPAEVAKIILAN